MSGCPAWTKSRPPSPITAGPGRQGPYPRHLRSGPVRVSQLEAGAADSCPKTRHLLNCSRLSARSPAETRSSPPPQRDGSLTSSPRCYPTRTGTTTPSLASSPTGNKQCSPSSPPGPSTATSASSMRPRLGRHRDQSSPSPAAIKGDRIRSYAPEDEQGPGAASRRSRPPAGDRSVIKKAAADCGDQRRGPGPRRRAALVLFSGVCGYPRRVTGRSDLFQEAVDDQHLVAGPGRPPRRSSAGRMRARLSVTCGGGSMGRCGSTRAAGGPTARTRRTTGRFRSAWSSPAPSRLAWRRSRCAASTARRWCPAGVVPAWPGRRATRRWSLTGPSTAMASSRSIPGHGPAWSSRASCWTSSTRQLAPHGLMFGPQPATHDHCTLGGMIGNNSCGATAQAYGKTVDNVRPARGADL